ERRGDDPVAGDAVPGGARRQGGLEGGPGQRGRGLRPRPGLPAQRGERPEMLGGGLALGEAGGGGEQGLARRLGGRGRARGGGGRVVDLVREAGGERAEGDERLALPRRRLDGARGAVEPPDEVPAEREPGGDQLT